ncbi:hypothetical protein [Methanosalsum natronophilum]|uniref:Uncharacterized protein n=1 Tax=Methanosalsum natronophilum TaxID=768733 RepID=A0A3R7XH07_9EURY|nr:hypothetical protein [Methanosalsum natronophilum]MCS3924322.1 hypothetical protein [Methanosalsum natronophilum]RQD83470.1 MAG: hypothetical protein D5R95_06265 [Methanosalsum natronophilum]
MPTLSEKDIKKIALLSINYILSSLQQKTGYVTTDRPSKNNGLPNSAMQKTYENILKNELVSSSLISNEKNKLHMAANILVEPNFDMSNVTFYLVICNSDDYIEIQATGVYRSDIDLKGSRFQLSQIYVNPI